MAKLILKLIHGRNTPDEELNDWGFNGPEIEITCFGVTYDNFWYVTPNKDHDDDRHDLGKHGDLIIYEDKYYGDFQIFNTKNPYIQLTKSYELI